MSFKWSQAEDDLLLSLIPVMSFGQMLVQGHFPNRTTNALIGRHKRLRPEDKLDFHRHSKNRHLKNPISPPSRDSAETRISMVALFNSKNFGSAATALPVDLHVPKKPISLLDLTMSSCRYPLESGLFCGDEKLFGTSYCPTHAAVCLRPFTSKSAKRVGFVRS